MSCLLEILETSALGCRTPDEELAAQLQQAVRWCRPRTTHAQLVVHFQVMILPNAPNIAGCQHNNYGPQMVAGACSPLATCAVLCSCCAHPGCLCQGSACAGMPDDCCIAQASGVSVLQNLRPCPDCSCSPLPGGQAAGRQTVCLMVLWVHHRPVYCAGSGRARAADAGPLSRRLRHHRPGPGAAGLQRPAGPGCLGPGAGGPRTC